MAKTIDRVAFEFWCGTGEVSDLETWAELELGKDEPHPDACEMFGLDKYQAEEASLKLAKEITGFEPVSELGEKWAKEKLKEYCLLLVEEKIKPYQFCKLVQIFDANFLGMRTLQDGSLEYPVWLGNLWNCCDWCDESWSNSNSPHLLKEAKKVLNAKT